MKCLTIQNKGQVSDTIFLNGESILEPVKCSFDAERPCSPNCASCDIFSSMPEKAQCLRGSFIIGSL